MSSVSSPRLDRRLDAALEAAERRRLERLVVRLAGRIGRRRVRRRGERGVDVDAARSRSAGRARSSCAGLAFGGVRSRAVLSRSSITWSFVRVGCAANSSAAAALTCGAANDVPSTVPSGLTTSPCRRVLRRAGCGGIARHRGQDLEPGRGEVVVDRVAVREARRARVGADRGDAEHVRQRRGVARVAVRASLSSCRWRRRSRRPSRTRSRSRPARRASTRRRSCPARACRRARG